MHGVIYGILYTQYTLKHFIISHMYVVYCILYNVDMSLYTVYNVLYSIQCTLQYTMYICTIYSRVLQTPHDFLNFRIKACHLPNCDK